MSCKNIAYVGASTVTVIDRDPCSGFPVLQDIPGWSVSFIVLMPRLV